jgi:hypothetical protein
MSESPRQLQIRLASLVLQRHAAGEGLIPAYRHPLLRKTHRGTTWRWITSGRLATITIGKVVFSVESLIFEALAAEPRRVRRKTTERDERHQLAMDVIGGGTHKKTAKV